MDSPDPLGQHCLPGFTPIKDEPVSSTSEVAYGGSCRNLSMISDTPDRLRASHASRATHSSHGNIPDLHKETTNNTIKLEVPMVKPEIKLAPLEVDTSMGLEAALAAVPHGKVEPPSPHHGVNHHHHHHDNHHHHHKSRQTGAHGGSGANHGHGSTHKHRPSNLNLNVRHGGGGSSQQLQQQQHSPSNQSSHYLSAASIVPDSTHRSVSLTAILTFSYSSWALCTYPDKLLNGFHFEPAVFTIKWQWHE